MRVSVRIAWSTLWTAGGERDRVLVFRRGGALSLSEAFISHRNLFEFRGDVPFFINMEHAISFGRCFVMIISGVTATSGSGHQDPIFAPFRVPVKMSTDHGEESFMLE